MDSYLLYQDQSRGCRFGFFFLSLQLHATFELGLPFNKQDFSAKLALEVLISTCVDGKYKKTVL